MISLPPTITLAEARSRGFPSASKQQVIAWATPSVADRLRVLGPWEVTLEAPVLTASTVWLLAVGGGSLIDKAKVLRSKHPHVKLAALPTIWGSGAEASPIAVLNEDGVKVIHTGAELIPDMIVSYPEFAQTLPNNLIRFACGDAWSHALEGFLSPLGSDESRADLAQVMKGLLQLPSGYAAEWFKLSALACAGQAKTSVGLVHGIAHVMECTMQWSHAKLCSLYLLPVMTFNKANSLKWPLLAEHGLSEDAIFRVLKQLFDERTYAAALTTLRSSWIKVLRNPCSRTNSALVRPTDIEYFDSFRV